ncbi:MAG: c-type cytochrome domain-containing protein, partial [Verrucomicrobiales bacterium]
MKMPSKFLAAILLASGSAGLRAQDAPVDFVRDIQPILEFNCVNCHNADDAKGGLRFDSRDAFLKGGDGGDAMLPGKPEKSLMVELISLPKDDDDVMPSKGRLLHAHEIDKVKKWIAAGAPWPDNLVLVAKKEDDFKGAEPLPEKGKKIAKVSVFPPNVNLETKRDAQSLIVMATYEDDTTLDVTKNAVFEYADPSLVELAKRNLIKPKKDGQT